MSAFPGDVVSLPQLHSAAALIPEVPHVYDRFAEIVALAKDRFDGELGGKLLLYGQLNAEGAAVALAANIAGAATLGVDADAERLRHGIRNGMCDFVVNHLDEALRILKNEVRKKQPVSVCLEGDFAEILHEAVERGLQPDLLAVRVEEGSQDDAELRVLVERGAIVLNNAEAKTSFAEVTWTAESAAAMWLPKADLLAAEVLPGGDERSRWLKLAPRYLGRAMANRRYLRMSDEELADFQTRVTAAVASGAIGTAITIQRQ
jgi:urocanate hydratase